MRRRAALCALAAAAAGCGDAPGPIRTLTHEYFPLAAGARWSFVRADGSEYTLAVVGAVERDGLPAWEVSNSAGPTEYFLDAEPVIHLRDPELSISGLWFEFLHKPPVLGNRWETEVPYTVGATGQTGRFYYRGGLPARAERTVAAGVFPGCYRLEIEASYEPPPTGSPATVGWRLWLAPGVGWIHRRVERRDGAGATLSVDEAELASYSLPRR